MNITTQAKKTWITIAATVIPLAAIVCAYSYWLISNTHPSVGGVLSATICVLLFCILGIRFIPSWIDAWSKDGTDNTYPSIGKRSARFARIHPIVSILMMLLASRIVIFLLSYLIVTAQNGYQGGILDLAGIWNPGSLDSRHYLAIAESGYSMEGNDRLRLVFFPFYPLLVKAVFYVFSSYFASGLIVSNLAFLGSGYLLYELSLLDYDRETALRTIKYLCLLPASVLFCAPMSDSLFLLECVACIYLTRRKRYLLACIMGFFAAFTRLPGLLLLVPVLFEMIGDLIASCREAKPSLRQLLPWLGRICSLFLIPAGLLLYLYLNFKLTGNSFTFLVYQRENWHQQAGWFFNTAEYQFNYAAACLSSGDYETLFGLWLPNLIYLFAALLLVILAQGSLRPAYVAYFIVYYAVTMGPTWLLSAPRYLTAAFPLAMSLGIITRRKWADLLATVFCAIGSLFYLYAFLFRWSVY